jgi:hypothetical protein
MVGPGGVPLSRDLKYLACPTTPRGASAAKGQFPELSNQPAGTRRAFSALHRSCFKSENNSMISMHQSANVPIVSQSAGNFDAAKGFVIHRGRFRRRIPPSDPRPEHRIVRGSGTRGT